MQKVHHRAMALLASVCMYLRMWTGETTAEIRAIKFFDFNLLFVEKCRIFQVCPPLAAFKGKETWT